MTKRGHSDSFLGQFKSKTLIIVLFFGLQQAHKMTKVSLNVGKPCGAAFNSVNSEVKSYIAF